MLPSDVPRDSKRVRLSRSLGKYEATREQCRPVMGTVKAGD